MNFTELNSSISSFLPIMNGIKDSLLDIVLVAVLMLLLSLVILLFLWMLGLVGKGTKILPFDVATQSKYNGNAISDLLVSELHRINVINNLESKGIRVSSERISLPQLAPARENLDSSIANIGTIGMGDSQLSVGNMLMLLKRLWPIGDPGSSLTGSLHKEGSTLALIARLDDKDTKAWKVSSSTRSGNDLSEVVRDLAFKIARDTSPECKAMTWEGFKYFTEALDNYHLLTQTKNPKYLQLSRDNCMKAKNIERGYESLVDLFYNLGLEYLNIGDESQAKEMFLCAISIKPNANAYNGLGNYYLSQEQFEEALLSFEIALKLDPKSSYACNGMGNVYTREMQAIDNNEMEALCNMCKEAIKAYNNALILDPKDAYSWNGKGNAYSNMVEHDQSYCTKAVDSYINAILLDANYICEAISYENPKIQTTYRNPYPWNGIGNVYAAMTRRRSRYREKREKYYKKSMKAYDNSIAIDPISPYPWNAKGNLHCIMMDSAEDGKNHYRPSIDAYKKALLLKQDYTLSREGICRAHRDAEEYEKAIKCYEAMINSKIFSASAFISLAECYKLSDNEIEFERVYRRFEAAIKDEKIKKPKLHPIYCSHERTLLRSNDFRDFLDLMQNLSPSPFENTSTPKYRSRIEAEPPWNNGSRPFWWRGL
jgi:tetratricopeptide (TPR) repeat protein